MRKEEEGATACCNLREGHLGQGLGGDSSGLCGGKRKAGGQGGDE